MRPVERDAVAHGPAQQQADRLAGFVAADVEQRVLDRGDRLLVQPAARLARRDMQPGQDRPALARVLPDQQRREGANDVGRPPRSEILVVFGPADDAAGGGDLQDGEGTPPRIGDDRLDMRDADAISPASARARR
jgi:hypothetical protein